MHMKDDSEIFEKNRAGRLRDSKTNNFSLSLNSGLRDFFDATSGHGKYPRVLRFAGFG